MKDELFNLHHASACNVIEWIFGVLKWKFHILHLAPEYSLDLQAHIPAALAAIHNFTRCHKHDDEEEDGDGDGDGGEPISGRVEIDDNEVELGWCWGEWTRHEVVWYCDHDVGAIHKQTYCTRAPCPWFVNKHLNSYPFHLSKTNILRAQQYEMMTIHWQYLDMSI